MLTNQFSNIHKEITPISEEDLFVILDHPNAKFDFPIHYHSDFEINLVLNSTGKRLVGDSVMNFGDIDLVMTGPNLPHVWKGTIEEGSHVITIQFHPQLLNFPILKKRLLNPIKELLQKSSRGIMFSKETALSARDKILTITRSNGFDTVLLFLSLLNDLAVSRNQTLLANSYFNPDDLGVDTRSRRINKVCEYINNNYTENIKLSDVAKLIGMSDSSFSHFFKNKTRMNFVDYVNDIRIGYAAIMLYETTNTISEVCYKCGFNNISNFIRVFKRKKGETPSDYRQKIKRVFVKF